DGIRIWRNGSFDMVKNLYTGTEVFSVALSNSYVAAGGQNGSVQVWTTDTFTLVKQFNAHDSFVYSMAFSPDGKTLATAGGDDEIKLWEVPALTLDQPLKGNRKTAFSMVFSADGRFIFAGGADGNARLWVVNNNSVSQTYAAGKKGILSVALSPNGEMAVAGGEDSSVSVWSTPWAYDQRVLQNNYQNAFNEGMTAMRSIIPVYGSHKAYAAFKKAGGFKMTPEVEQLIEKTSKTYRRGRNMFIFSVLFILGAGTFYLVYKFRRSMRLMLKEKASERMAEMLAQGKKDKARAFYLQLKRFGCDDAVLSPQQLFELFDTPEQLEAGNWPPQHLAHFVKELPKQGRHKDALRFFSKFKATVKDPYIPETFTAREIIDLYVNAGTPDYMAAEENLPPQDIISYALEMAKGGNIPGAFSLAGDISGILKHPEFGFELAQQLVELYSVSGTADDLFNTLRAQNFSNKVYLDVAAAFIKTGETALSERVFDIIRESGNPFSDEDYTYLLNIFIKDGKTVEAVEKMLPPNMQWRIAESMTQKGDLQNALNILNRRSRDLWEPDDYRVCMKIYSGMGLYDVAEEMLEHVRLEKTPQDLPGFFYEFAACAEQKGFLDRAYAIYRELIKSGAAYKDTLERYRAVRVKLGMADNETPAEGLPTAKPVSAPAAEKPAAALVAETAKPGSEPAEDKPAYTPAPAAAAPATQIQARTVPFSRAARLDMDAEAISQLKGGKLELVQELGKGGMGIVYKVFDKSLNRNVALKRMKDELTLSKKEADKFLNEARMVARLNHPNIVIVYEIIEKEDITFILFEYIDGKSLEKILDDSPEGLPVNDAVRILEQVCNGLSYAHKHNIIHRDLKPSNIMLVKDGLVKITDFGIARMAKDSIIRLTGASIGTLAYMAPEQELGTFDSRSDIYSLGVVMYEMLTGEHPFRGPNFYLQKEKMIFKPVSEIIPDIPPKLDAIVNKCISASPSDRYASIDELLKDMVGVSSS
ncbi:MAG: protein kinase, partial [Elusimicrobiaceae bacterium]